MEAGELLQAVCGARRRTIDATAKDAKGAKESKQNLTACMTLILLMNADRTWGIQITGSHNLSNSSAYSVTLC